MSAIFKFLFERATDPLGLPINALYEYIDAVKIYMVEFSDESEYVSRFAEYEKQAKE